MHVYQWHNEGFDLPRGAERLAVGPTFPNQAMRLGPRVYGLQFHAETTVDIFTRWMAEASHMLEEPGAHPRERQLADARRHDETLARWLDGFMSGWLGPADGDDTTTRTKT